MKLIKMLLLKRAGTGGLSSLFAADLFKMYEKVSHKKKWSVELISF